MTRATSSAFPGDDPVLRIHDPGDLLDALPRMLGYVPRRSAVLVALAPPRRRVVMTVRADLPPRRQEAACARVLAGHAQRAGAASAVLVVYDDTPGPGGRWRGASLARALRIALRQRGGLSLDDALGVRNGRWRSLLCRDDSCCSPTGAAVRAPDDPSVAAAALVAEGAAVLPDREALVASLAAPTGARAEQLAPLYRQHSAARPAGGRPAAAAMEEFAGALDARRDGRSPADDAAVGLVLALADVEVRDTVLSQAAGPDTATLLALLLDLATVAVPPHDPAPLAALAWVAHARGDGTIANIAIERALATDPTYSLALLIAAGLDAGLPPSHIRRVSREVALELRAPAGFDPAQDCLSCGAPSEPIEGRCSACNGPFDGYPRDDEERDEPA